MSCYNWERGEIIIPRQEFTKFRKAVITAVNDNLQNVFVVAQSFYKTILEKKLTVDAVKERLEKMHMQDEFKSLIFSVLYPDMQYDFFEDTPGYIKPKAVFASKFPFQSMKSVSIFNDDCSVHFHEGTHSVVWYVPENNRAVEHARQSMLGKVFFQKLNKLNFTPRSGGKIIGNDEYNRDSGGEGGGGNYVTGRYGGRGKP